MARLQLERETYEEVQTFGKLRILDDNDFPFFEVNCLELPWKYNQRRMSCIPEGIYPIRRYDSPTHGDVFLLESVPNRDYIEIHSGNFHYDILGCILPGHEIVDIDGDGWNDVTESRWALNELLKKTPESATTIEVFSKG